MRNLLHAGGEVNPVDNDGQTVLHVAATAGHVDMVKLLLAQGALVSLTTNVIPHQPSLTCGVGAACPCDGPVLLFLTLVSYGGVLACHNTQRAHQTVFVPEESQRVVRTRKSRGACSARSTN